MSKILLAGQNGIIGSFLYDTLKDNEEIKGIGKGQLDVPNYTDIDLSNIKEVEKFVKSTDRFDVLIFLVGLTHAKGKNQNYPVFKKGVYFIQFIYRLYFNSVAN